LPACGACVIPLAKAGLSPAEVAYVGDTHEDVQAARAAGLLPILIRREAVPLDLDAGEQSLESQACADDVVTISRLVDLGRFQTLSNDEDGMAEVLESILAEEVVGYRSKRNS